jgi:hypothetical protein
MTDDVLFIMLDGLWSLKVVVRDGFFSVNIVLVKVVFNDGFVCDGYFRDG